MAVHIRLQRHGSTHRPFYHVVAADSRMPRNGRFIEKIGTYNPNPNPSEINIKADRVQYWYERGAQMTPAVKNMVKQQKIELKRAGAKAEEAKS